MRQELLKNQTSIGDKLVYNPKKGKLKRDIWKYRNMYLFILPAFIWFIIFAYIPLYGFVLAFKDFNFGLGIMHSPWVGLRFFKGFMGDSDFYNVIRNTLTISTLKLLFGFPAPIILALMLNGVTNLKFKKVIQTVSYLPYFVSWVVVVSLLTKFLSPSAGVINDIRASMGQDPIYFLGIKKLFYVFIVSTDLWKNIGWGSIIYLAALTNIDPTLYEASSIDGSGRWADLWYITLPCLKPTIGILFIMSIGGLFNAGFEQVYLMQTPAVSNLSEILDTYVLKKGLMQGQFGYATAISMFQSVISLILVVTVNQISKKTTEVSLW